MRYAFCTLLSSKDYLVPVLILNRNLHDINSQYPLIVMVTNNIINDVKNYLDKEQINYVVINFVNYSSMVQERDAGSYILNTASKMGIFTLKEYDKLVYFDADSIFFKNIDELFKYPDGAMYDDSNGTDFGFSGMFVCIPRNHNLDFYITVLSNQPIWDGNLLGELWFPFRSNPDYRIPYKYFINITTTNLDQIYLNDECYGIHFCYFYKPWRYKTVKEYLNDYYGFQKN